MIQVEFYHNSALRREMNLSAEEVSVILETKELSLPSSIDGHENFRVKYAVFTVREDDSKALVLTLEKITRDEL